MKRYLRKFEFTEKFVVDSMLECLSHKTGKIIRWKRKDTSYFLADYYIKGNYTEKINIHEVANFIRKDINNNFFFYQNNLIPYIARELIKEIKSRNIQLSPIVYQQRVDRSSLKVRDIGITSIKQQVYDYICVNAMKPMFNAKIGYYQCSSIKGRGQKHAKKAIEKCIRKKHKKARYVIKSDIKKCYQSIRHDILFRVIERDVKNKDIYHLATSLISTYSNNETGLCIGTYLSQYLANYYLSYAYHFITENAFVTRKERKTGKIKKIMPFTRVVFYMDDMVFIGSNKKHMKKAMNEFIKYLKNNLCLELKHDTYQVIDLFKDKAFVDVVGFRFYKDHTTIRKRIFRRISKDTKIINKFDKDVDIAICRGFMSRHGFVKKCNSVKFKRKSKYNKVFQIARKVIGDETRNTLHRETTDCQISES